MSNGDSHVQESVRQALAGASGADPAVAAAVGASAANAAIGPTDRWVADTLWLVLVLSLALLVLGSGTTLIWASLNNKPTDVLLPIFTTTLGTFVGLFVPSRSTS